MEEKDSIDKIIDKLATATRSPKGIYSAGESYKLLYRRIFARRRRLKLIRFSSAAAAVILLSVLSWSIYNHSESNIILTVNTLAETRDIVLPDGTEVMLNRYSTLTYPEKFKGSKREVHILGEAYFEVTHDQSHPFIVHTTDLNVEVLGTHFNVEAYPRDEEISTTLFEGSVAVTGKESSERKVLIPNERAVYNKETGRMSLETLTNPADGIAWRNGEFLFERVTLGEIARKLSNAFNVDIVVDQTLSRYKMTGSFRNAETLEDMLQLLSHAGKFRYETQEQTIYISSEKQKTMPADNSRRNND